MFSELCPFHVRWRALCKRFNDYVDLYCYDYYDYDFYDYYDYYDYVDHCFYSYNHYCYDYHDYPSLPQAAPFGLWAEASSHQKRDGC
jgi:hypothetical protein